MITEKETIIPADERQMCLDLLHLFQIEGRPGDEMVTEGQLKLFWAIVFRPSNRVQIICPTQYGKSLFVALACIVVSCVQEEVIAVVAPSGEKAKIIMRYYIEHLGDDVLFSEKLDAHTKLDRLRQEESKDRILLRKSDLTGKQGGIFVVSANTGNSKKTLESAMGLGAKIVIGDEYCLIPDDTEATIFRMIAGKGPDAFYCKIGNPFYRDKPYSHFYKTWTGDNNYLKILIDYRQGLQEGRYNAEFIAEAKEKPQFDILYECKFPPEGVADPDGWIPLFTETEIEIAQEAAEEIAIAGVKLMGVDVAEGKGQDASAIVERGMNVAECLFESNTVDEMQLCGHVVLASEQRGIDPHNIGLDGNGSGSGAVARLREQKKPIQSINTAEVSSDPKRFFNKRAEGYWAVRTWIKNGGKLKPHKRWAELKNIKYKVHSSGRIIIMPKDEMRKRGLPSPDVCDGLMHTFLITPVGHGATPEELFFVRKMRQNKMKDALASRKIKRRG